MIISFSNRLAQILSRGVLALFVLSAGPVVAETPAAGETQPNAMTDSDNSSEVIARIGNLDITRADVDRRIDRQAPATGQSTAEQWIATRDRLLAMILVEYRMQTSGEPMPPELHAAIEEARRQVILDYHLARNIRAYTPTEAEIDAFIRDNARLFDGRAIYRYMELLVFPHKSGDLVGAEQMIAQTLPDSRVGQQDVKRLTEALEAAGLQFGLQSLLRSSEQLPVPVLDRLESLAAASRQFVLEPASEGLRLTILLQREADPVDPARIRPQIVEGLIRMDSDRQRLAAIENLAGKAMADGGPGRAGSSDLTSAPLRRPARPEQALLAAIAALMVLLGAGAAARMRTIPEDQLNAYRDGYRPDRMANPTVIKVIALLFVLTGLLFASAASVPLINLLGLRQAGVALLTGALPAALLGGVTLCRNQARPQRWTGPILLLAGLFTIASYILARQA